MPRRSVPELTIVPIVPGKGRPEPPKTLSRAEAQAWADIVDAMPAQWVDTAGQLILRRVAAQVAIAERLEDKLRLMAEAPINPETLEAEKLLGAIHRETTKAIANGLTALRATPRSRLSTRDGGSRTARRMNAFRPWEIVAKKVEPDGEVR
jgi:hypothetical protein